MVEAGGELALAAEALPEVIARELGGQQLESHRAVQRELLGAVDDRHTADADHVLDLVAAEDVPPAQHEACGLQRSAQLLACAASTRHRRLVGNGFTIWGQILVSASVRLILRRPCREGGSGTEIPH